MIQHCFSEANQEVDALAKWNIDQAEALYMNLKDLPKQVKDHIFLQQGPNGFGKA